MAPISMFYGLIIYLYQFDWIDGVFKSDKAKLVQAWIVLHKEELLANWDLAIAGQQVFKIDPLK